MKEEYFYMMVKNWKALALSGAMVLSLCACGGQDAAVTPSAPAEPTQSVVPEPSPIQSVAASEGEADFFKTLPNQFSFLSGAGGWSTALYLNGGGIYDGSFTGQYHDSNMGSTGEDYPNGEVYYCNFSGKFTQPEKLDEFVYSVKLEDLTYDPPEVESIEDGVRYVTAKPYGLENAEELRIYFPGYPIKNIPEADRVWLLSAPELAQYTLDELGEQVLPGNTYLIHNVSEGQLFFGSLPEFTVNDDSGLVEPTA